jgi:Helix-turn-helix domain
MERFALDAYVIDVLMPDLVGHDRRPATFIVYLFLLRQAARGRRDRITVSLQTIATRTGLSKSTVQSALRHLRRRRLIDPSVTATVTAPVRQILRPWVRATISPSAG